MLDELLRLSGVILQEYTNNNLDALNAAFKAFQSIYAANSRSWTQAVRDHDCYDDHDDGITHDLTEFICAIDIGWWRKASTCTVRWCWMAFDTLNDTITELKNIYKPMSTVTRKRLVDIAVLSAQREERRYYWYVDQILALFDRARNKVSWTILRRYKHCQLHVYNKTRWRCW